MGFDSQQLKQSQRDNSSVDTYHNLLCGNRLHTAPNEAKDFSRSADQRIERICPTTYAQMTRFLEINEKR